MYHIRCPLREAGSVGKNQVGLICPQGRLTFYEYDQAVSATARMLRDAGVGPGTRLGVNIGEGWQQQIFFFAALRSGAVACYVEDDAANHSLVADMSAIACRHAVVGETIRRDASDGIRYFKASETISMTLARDESDLTFAFEGHRPATITFSGRSPARRALLHSYGSFYYGALGAKVGMNLRTNDRWMIGTEFGRIQTLSAVFCCAVSGATLVVPEPKASFADNLLASEATHAHLEAEDLEALLGSDRMSGCRLKVAMVSAALSEELWQEARKAGIRVQTCYGIPEMASQVTAMTRLSPVSKHRTVGSAMRYNEVRIAENGRIQVRGRALFDGYVEGERVIPAADVDGWFTTDDCGSLDGEGYLNMTPRETS